jgi:hypothetical protein
MKYRILAALALTAASSLPAQTVADLSTATPLSGSWAYAPVAGGTQASFSDASGNPQLWVQCTRATRRVSIAKRASTAAPFISVWTSSMVRSVPSAFNPATGRLTMEIAAFDPLLDAITGSRGRIGFAVGTEPPLVVPPWAEAARVIEDCRA